jgi:hypothetical protein
MNYGYSSAIPINYNVLGLPIPEDSSLGKSEPIAFTFKELPETLFSPKPNISITRLELEDIAPDPMWHLSPAWNLQVQNVVIVQGNERNWDEVIEEVLHARAQTWKELADL